MKRSKKVKGSKTAELPVDIRGNLAASSLELLWKNIHHIPDTRLDRAIQLVASCYMVLRERQDHKEKEAKK